MSQSLIATFAIAVVVTAGLRFCYRKNGGANGEQFLDRTLALVAALFREDLVGERIDRLLVIVVAEIHAVFLLPVRPYVRLCIRLYMRGTRGRPRPKSPMRSRCTSLVPPP